MSLPSVSPAGEVDGIYYGRPEVGPPPPIRTRKRPRPLRITINVEGPADAAAVAELLKQFGDAIKTFKQSVPPSDDAPA